MARKSGSQDVYYSNDGLGSDAAQIVDIKDGKIKIAFWNENSKAKVPKTKITELSEDYFFSDKCGWKQKPQKLVELERDPSTLELVGQIDGGMISRRVVASNLGINPKWMDYLFKKLVKKFREHQPVIDNAETGSLSGFFKRLTN